MIGHGVPGLDIRQEHEYSATAAAVFTALTLGIDAWWPLDARVTGEAATLSLVPELGAALVETHGSTGCIWGVVDCLEQDRRLYFNGWFGVAGVVAGRVHYDISETERGARLELMHQAIGPVPEDQHSRRRTLWRKILDQNLRDYLQGTLV